MRMHSKILFNTKKKRAAIELSNRLKKRSMQRILDWWSLIHPCCCCCCYIYIFKFFFGFLGSFVGRWWWIFVWYAHGGWNYRMCLLRASVTAANGALSVDRINWHIFRSAAFTVYRKVGYRCISDAQASSIWTRCRVTLALCDGRRCTNNET